VWKLAFETGLLALEAQQVILLRAARLAQGGAPVTEVQRMFVEKAIVGANVAFSTALGGGPRTVVKKYRGRVRRNVRRLSR
jgi:hypothetical protein